MRDFTTNQELMSTAGPGDVVRIDGKQLPPILAQAGAEAWRHFLDLHCPSRRYARACDDISCAMGALLK